MTLEEAIKHCIEVAKTCEMEVLERSNLPFSVVGYEDAKKRDLDRKRECASEHRQLAEWLKELKAYRKAEKEIEQELVNWNDIDNGKCRGLFLATSIIQNYKDGEVNADEIHS